MTHWTTPPDVTGPSPHDPNRQMKFGISRSFLVRLAEKNQLSDIWQIWAHVVGELPPINNIRRVMSAQDAPTILTLNDATACFEGAMRPYDGERDGASVLFYVLKPKTTLISSVDMVCRAQT
jgi:hypothetical protein